MLAGLNITALEPKAADRVWRSHGYIIGVAHHPKEVGLQTGPRVMFLSASPDARVVGATASTLLEVDEAQDVSVEKFNTDLRPMISTKNATTVLYGTAWSDDTLLAQGMTNTIGLVDLGVIHVPTVIFVI